MASGSISGSIKGGAYTVRVDWATVDDVANNRSQVVATMYLVQATYASLDIWSRECAIWIDGTKYPFNSPYEISNSGGCTTKLGQVTSNYISHNTDGSKSVKMSAAFNIQATISGTWYNSIDVAEQTIGLTTLPRATTPSMSASSANMGEKITINTPRASSAFTHTLEYSFAGGSYVTFATGVTTSYTWTVPDLASSIPNSVSGLMTIRCTTYNGSKSVGSKVTSFTATVPSSVVPTISGVSLSEAVSGVAAQFGAYIQGKSKIKAVISASGAKGSKISSYSTTFDGATYNGASWTTGYIGGSGTIRMLTTVVDSRGRVAQKATDVAVLAYALPTISTFTAYRCLQDGTANDDGEYIIATYAYKVLSLNGGNTASIVIQKKKSSESSWVTVHTLSGLEASGSVQLSDFSIDYQWDVRIMITDYFGTPVYYAALVPSDDVIMDINAEGKGLAIGKTSESNEFDVGWDTTLRGGLYVAGYESLDYGEDKTDSDGSKLRAYLDMLISKMPDKSIKHVTTCFYKFMSGSGYNTIIYKRDKDWVVVTFESYTYRYDRIILVKYNGAWGPMQYDNPPMIIGVEYATTERYNGNIVFTKLINCGTNTNGKQIYTGHGTMFRHEGNFDMRVALPYLPLGVTSYYATSRNDYERLTLTCNGDIANRFTWYEQIWWY